MESEREREPRFSSFANLRREWHSTSTTTQPWRLSPRGSQFGLLTFELFGQTRNFVNDDAALFRATEAMKATAIGLGGHSVRARSQEKRHV